MACISQSAIRRHSLQWVGEKVVGCWRCLSYLQAITARKDGEVVLGDLHRFQPGIASVRQNDLQAITKVDGEMKGQESYACAVWTSFNTLSQCQVP